jgi:hypothetical protein
MRSAWQDTLPSPALRWLATRIDHRGDQFDKALKKMGLESSRQYSGQLDLSLVTPPVQLTN